MNIQDIFSDFGLEVPAAAPAAKKPTTTAGGRQDGATIRRLNVGPHDWQLMLIFSPTDGTIREVEVDVAHLSAQAYDMKDGGWVSRKFVAPLSMRAILEREYAIITEARLAYEKIRDFRTSRCFYFADQARQEFARELAVAKELGV